MTMKLLRRTLRSGPRICMPATKTIVKHWRMTPPTIGIGMEAIAAPTLPKSPMKMSQPAHAKPAERDAHLVSAMMPLFCENVVLGGEPQRHAMMELTPSASTPPCCLATISASSVTFENFAVILTSPMVSAVVMKEQMSSGRKYSIAKPGVNWISDQKKVKTGAFEMRVSVQYPRVSPVAGSLYVAMAETRQPNIIDQKRKVDLR
mmetsp:Transcript_50018/g.161109  ORF Transcript_50018/g.161109 Transcript_50018/m.161109 type:complete len:205 (-) Transcript_50018:1017-1631(-)